MSSTPSGPAIPAGRGARWRAACVVFAALLPGCLTARQYARQADQEAYGIIQAKWDRRFGAPGDYRLEEPSPEPNRPAVEGRLSLAEAVAVATRYNRDYQRQKELLYGEALDLTLERWRFAHQWLGVLNGEYARDAADESVGADATVGVSRLLADGAQVGLQVGLAWLEYLTGDPRSSLTSVLSATVSQPLLRGFGRKVAQEDLTQAERDALYQVRSFCRFRKTFVVSIIADYYGVLQALDRVRNDRLNYENLLANQRRVEMMADTGRVPRFQAGEVRQSALNALDRYTRSQEAYKSALEAFKLRLALPPDANIVLDANELKALEAAGVARPKLPLAQAVEAGLTLRLDLANARDAAEDAERKVAVAADALRPEVNVTARAEVPSTDPRDAARMQFHKGTYGVGLEVDLPLDRTVERNLYRRSLIALADSRRTYVEQADRVRLEIRQAWRDLLEAHTSYRIQQESLELAERRVDMQMHLLEEGRATTRNYLDAQEDLVRAQNARTAALVDFTLASLRFYRDVGLLEVRPDGSWRARPGPATRPARRGFRKD